MTPRRLTFQLTPLLDLLLIVIFAQFMDVRETTQQQEQSAAVQLSDVDRQLEAARATIETLERANQQAAVQSERHRLTIADLERLADERAQTSGGVQGMLESVRRERDATATMLAELLRITPEEVATLASSIDAEAERANYAQEIERELKNHSNENTPADAVRHAMMFDELAKRCDIWQLHIDDNGFTTLTAGHWPARFQAYTSAEFEHELFEKYKSQPPPKQLVLLLLTHANAKAMFIEAAASGLPQAADRMRKDQSDRTRFEYAILGYNPAPLFR